VPAGEAVPDRLGVRHATMSTTLSPASCVTTGTSPGRRTSPADQLVRRHPDLPLHARGWPHRYAVAPEILFRLRHGMLPVVEDGGREHRVRPPAVTPSSRCARVPTPPEAITGCEPHRRWARVSGMS